MFNKKTETVEKPIEKFVFSKPIDALNKVNEIGNVKFDMKPFDGIHKKKPEYLVIKENGIWYLKLC